MSEIMLAVLEMPEELFWADDPMSRHQHNQVRKEAAKEIRENRTRIAELEDQVRTAGAEALGEMAVRFHDIAESADSGTAWRSYYSKAAEECEVEARRLRGEGE